ncbi:hypothetical protein GGR88_000778 [Sphingomonas jejuensis]|uniref:PEP-CTERM protein-sorting domain-containing protein n=1 Tax=Sphingomonas jejuensis TaxID=904715 RepID=A0ABX0XJ94_9SPHN|nr:PEPxxWA-CTERM sorting domain-containing protein [Sphingomonas jejuensis]NJC33304.1 hypothetical protein [Sphingomonas jejuensis]
MSKPVFLRAIIGSGAALLCAGAAPAAIVETVRVTNTYGLSFTPFTLPSELPGGSRETLIQRSGVPGADSEAGIDLVGEADSGGFFFLHNDYCVGQCAIASSTEIRFVVTNTGTEAVNLRFDSLITPGHLARIGNDPRATGGFDFRVTQQDTDPFEENIPELLYSAFGNVNAEDIFVETTGGVPFNNYNDQTIGDGRVVDWSWTPLNLELGLLGAGQSKIVTYSAFYFMTGNGVCEDVANCSGLQVAFGDPRNNGTILSRMASFAAFADDGTPIINREYDAVSVPFAFNLSGSPLPPLPPTEGPVNYGVPFVPAALGAVPEPATWATMVCGFGLVGSTLRRRRPLTA